MFNHCQCFWRRSRLRGSDAPPYDAMEGTLFQVPSTEFMENIRLWELHRRRGRIDDALDRRGDLLLEAADGDLVGAAVAQADVAGTLVNAHVPEDIRVLRRR